MDETQLLPPPVLWAQRKNLLYVKVQLEDCKNPVIKLEKDKLYFRGKGGTENKEHEVTLEFFKDIKPEDSKQAVKDRAVEFVLIKAEEGTFWKRLLKDDKKFHWLKVDFNKWKDEDDSDDDAEGTDFEEMMRQMGGGIYAYECDICKNVFASEVFLTRHRRTHRGEGRGSKQFTCELCLYSTDVLSSIKRHRLIHTGVKPHGCSYCGKRFALENTLRTHELIHTGERPFACGICDKSFTRAGNLYVHRRIHFQEKPYVCKHCGESFTWQKQLKRHEQCH